jgi:hypothetical protein
MALFEITGKGRESGRKRTRSYYARNEAEARQKAEQDGTVVEHVQAFPSGPPTEAQLKFARELGVSVPTNATKDDVSVLIDEGIQKRDRHKVASPRIQSFARSFGLNPDPNVWKKDLFDQIQNALSRTGRESELLSWFVFRVHRTIVHGADNDPVSGPLDPIILNIASQLMNDAKVIASVRRYRGRELIWFGEWTTPEGLVVSGGSNRTIAYHEASRLLKQSVTITRAKPEAAPKPVTGIDQDAARSSGGCISVVFLCLLVPAGLVVYVLL